MKTKTPFNIESFLPHADDLQYAGQISDHPLFPEKIGRILVVTKYFPDADNHRLTIHGYLIHVDIETNEVVNSFKNCLEDWVVSDQYKVVIRDANGMMIPSPDYIPEEDREKIEDLPEGQEPIIYTDNQLYPFLTLPAYIRFSRMIKTYAVPAQVLFQKIVEMDDQLNNIFDLYGNIQEYLINKPLEFENPLNKKASRK